MFEPPTGANFSSGFGRYARCYQRCLTRHLAHESWQSCSRFALCELDRLSVTDVAHELARTAALKAGASCSVAVSLADATISAEGAGSHAVGFAHLLDYLNGFRDGRISRDIEPEVSYPAAAMIEVDAKRGIAQLGFDRAFDEFVTRVNLRSRRLKTGSASRNRFAIEVLDERLIKWRTASA